MSFVHSIRSAWPLWSLDQKNESYGLWYGGQVQGIFLGEKHLGCYLWHGNMMGFLTVLLLRNCGRNRWVIKNDPLIPTTPSSTPLRHGLMENKEERWIMQRSSSTLCQKKSTHLHILIRLYDSFLLGSSLWLSNISKVDMPLLLLPWAPHKTN